MLQWNQDGRRQVWELQKHSAFWVSKDLGEGDIPAEIWVINKPTRGALHWDDEKGGSKRLLCSNTQNISLEYHKNTEANHQEGNHRKSRCERELTLRPTEFESYGKHPSKPCRSLHCQESGGCRPSPTFLGILTNVILLEDLPASCQFY